MKNRAFFNWLMIFLGVVAIMGFCFTPAFADEPGDDMEIQDDSFGEGYQYTWIPCFSFVPTGSPGSYTTFSTFSNNYLWSTGNGFDMVGSINLPSGAFLSVVRIEYIGGAGDIIMHVFRGYPGGGDPYNFETLGSFTSPASGSSGTININRTIANGNNIYYIRVTGNRGSPSCAFFGVRLYWRRQISPAPATATFNDVGPGHWAFQSVEALAASGITKGCPDGPNLFCPDKPVSRAAMAAFLARALGLHWDYLDGY